MISAPEQKSDSKTQYQIYFNFGDDKTISFLFGSRQD